MLLEIVLSLLCYISLEPPVNALPSYGLENFPTRLTVNHPLTLTWFRGTDDEINTLEVIPVVEGGKPVTSFGDNRILIPVGTNTKGDITITPTVTGIFGLNVLADPTTSVTAGTGAVALPVRTLVLVDSPTTSSHLPTSSHGTPPPSGSITGSTATSTPSPPPKRNSGEIAGHVIGGLAGLIVLSLLAYFIWRRIRSKRRKEEGPSPLAIIPFRETAGYPSITKIRPSKEASCAAVTPTTETSSSSYTYTSSSSQLDSPQHLRQGANQTEVSVRRAQDGGRVRVQEVVLPPIYDIRWCSV